jgi:hypothetical protein
VRSVIRQVVNLDAPAEALFEAYLDPARHAAITGDTCADFASLSSVFASIGK